MKSARKSTYAECEDRERSWLNIMNRLRPSQFSRPTFSKVNSYASYDAIMTFNGEEAIVEVKIREIFADQFSTAFLELNKLNRLKEKQKELAKKGQDFKLHYYAFYPKSKKLIIFDLLTTPYFKRSVWAPRTTAQGGSQKIEKIMCEFDLEDGTTIDLSPETEQPEKKQGPTTNPLF